MHIEHASHLHNFTSDSSSLRMSFPLVLSVLILALYHSEASNECCKKEVELGFLEYVTYDQCDGKDSGNYTLIQQFTRDQLCDRKSSRLNDKDVLLSCAPNSKVSRVNQLQILANSILPNGAFTNREVLYLALNGPMEGKYLYEKEIIQEPEYLKICSSILGYSYVNSKSNTLLISDKLDLNVLIAPNGGFEVFKKGCTTICQGRSIIVGPTMLNTKK